MGTRQYIGARYVPKFADPIEWNENMVYESLTIVNYLGGSYTSKKAVPAGIVPTNTAYWALTGNYNAQVEQYRQEVEDLAAEVAEIAAGDTISDRIKNKNIVIYGASGSVDTVNTWVYPFRQKMEALGNTITVRAQGGKCLTRYNGERGENPCVSKMIFDATAADLGSFDIIIIYAGINDFREGIQLGEVTASAIASTAEGNNASFNSGLASIANSIHSKAPGAFVFIVSPLSNWEMYEADEQATKHWGHYPSNHKPQNPLIVYANAMENWAHINGFTYIDGKGSPMLMATIAAMRTQWQPDGLHTKSTYAPYLCDYIFFHILTLISDTSHWADVRYDLKDLNAKMIQAGLTGFLVADFISASNTTVTGVFHNDGTFSLHFLLLGSMTENEDTIVMTLPESMSPSASIYTTCNYNTTGGARSVGVVNIDTDGDVHLRPTSTGSLYCTMDVTYSLKCCARQIRDMQPNVYNV